MHLCRFLRILLFPAGLRSMAFSHDFPEFGCTVIVELLYFREDSERVVGIAAEVFHRIYIGIASERCAVCLYAVFVAAAVGLACAFGHDGVADDEGGAVLFPVGSGECLTDGIWVVAVDIHDVPSPCPVFHGRVFIHDGSAFGGELYVVGIVEHDEVVQSECACQSSDFCADAFLDASVGDVGVYLVLHHGVSEACLEEFLCHGGSCGIGVSLSERA